MCEEEEEDMKETRKMYLKRHEADGMRRGNR